MLLNALARSGQHAELVHVKLQHPASRPAMLPRYHGMLGNYNHDQYYDGHGHTYGVGPYGAHPHQQPYPIHDPYWYERKPLQPSPLPTMHYPYYASTSSFAFDDHRPPITRYDIIISFQ